MVAVFPVVYSFWISLFDLKLTRPHRVPFVWFDNYVKVFQDPLFWESVQRTDELHRDVGGRHHGDRHADGAAAQRGIPRAGACCRAILLIPWAIPYVANGLMWKWIYDSGYGALNGLLLQLGFIDKYLVWLGDVDKTLVLITNAFVWKEVPLATILLLVTLKSIRADLYSAAKVDGANAWQRFVHITLPSLVPGLRAGDDLRDDDGDPPLRPVLHPHRGRAGRGQSHVVAWQVYVETFRKLAFGTGAALAYIMAIATFTLAFFIIRSTEPQAVT